ncbi:S-adenosyl-L-methionine-dependent methyltransferase [Schizothecium vesticola]|uniref:S-adenosyl-L-methionine-dependent methyltransferase n=1 Tax=Schizothecium vesticola TaxID=314040 RepID=A0AA40K4B3_9PEZI|nr:S-adenosyl-L-methionine-dependent methyltransferase [Schizothecium vesticola]
MPPDFDKQSYWHHRFLSETTFEWLASSETFLEVAAPFLRRLPRDAPILQLGCGTSDLHIHLRRQGFDNVTNVDFEPLAIEKGRAMEQLAFGDTRNKYLVADVLTLDLGTKFDLVLDKSTADTIACCEGPSVLAMAHRVKNHLAENGAWLSLSFSAFRFQIEDGTLPLKAEVIDKLPTPKRNPTDPDIFHFCYLLQNGTSKTTLGDQLQGRRRG